MNSLNKIWNNYRYSLKDQIIITNKVISESINTFWKSEVKDINSNQHIIVLFRIKTCDGVILTLGHLQKLSQDDKDYFIQYVQDILSMKSEDYNEFLIDEIIFSYGIRQGDVISKDTYQPKSNKTVQYQLYKHYKLPVTMDPLKYGKLTYYDKATNTYIIQITPLTHAHVMPAVEDGINENKVQIFKNGAMILEYTDRMIDDNTFIRILGKNIYQCNLTGELELFKVSKPTKFIKPIKTSKNKTFKAITMDIETKIIDDQHVPYLISYYDGKKSHPFYANDYKSSEDMLKECILSLCRDKFNNHKVYIHNLANFDGIFLMKTLIQLGEVKPVMNKGKIISIQFKFSNPNSEKAIIIHFRDSLQILKSSLDKLGKNFQIETLKSNFPHRFVNEVELDYIGTMPDFKYFDKLTLEEYDNMCKQNLGEWNLKDEAIKYCIQDCISLYQVMVKFNDLIFDRFGLNVNNCSTITRLAFDIFRAHYLKENTIPMIHGDIYDHIKMSYTGGGTDMYIPSNSSKELVYGYDVNSLYPSVMEKFDMPVGKVTYFEGDIRKYQLDAFGFFYCKIEAPDNLAHPILQTHVKTKGGLRTVSALGTFYDVIFSFEMDNAVKLGYQFEILWGYSFDKDNIFKDFVNDLYNLRLEYPKSHPMNFIAKIIMNSLYGRFGMRDDFDQIKIVDQIELDVFLNEFSSSSSSAHEVKEIIELDDHFLIQIKSKLDSVSSEFINKDYNINIAIASAITSYSRIEMSKFKNNPNLKLFYTDTDSIYTNLSPDQMNELYPGIVSSSGLGKLKLETVSKKAIFLAPKCYALETIDGDFINKVKGLKKQVPIIFKDFEFLLYKDSKLVKKQTKWYKSLTKGTIDVLNQSYTLRQTDNKRQLFFDSNNKLIFTKPFHIDERKEFSQVNQEC